MNKVYRVEFDNVAVIAINEHDNSVTYTNNKVIVDTLYNAKTLLLGMGVNCAYLDYFIKTFNDAE